MVELFANRSDVDQMAHSAASDLGLRCLPVTHFRVSSLQWDNTQQNPIAKMSDEYNICFVEKGRKNIFWSHTFCILYLS